MTENNDSGLRSRIRNTAVLGAAVGGSWLSLQYLATRGVHLGRASVASKSAKKIKTAVESFDAKKASEEILALLEHPDLFEYQKTAAHAAAISMAKKRSGVVREFSTLSDAIAYGETNVSFQKNLLSASRELEKTLFEEVRHREKYLKSPLRFATTDYISKPLVKQSSGFYLFAERRGSWFNDITKAISDIPGLKNRQDISALAQSMADVAASIAGTSNISVKFYAADMLHGGQIQREIIGVGFLRNNTNEAYFPILTASNKYVVGRNQTTIYAPKRVVVDPDMFVETLGAKGHVGLDVYHMSKFVEQYKTNTNINKLARSTQLDVMRHAVYSDDYGRFKPSFTRNSVRDVIRSSGFVFPTISQTAFIQKAEELIERGVDIGGIPGQHIAKNTLFLNLNKYYMFGDTGDRDKFMRMITRDVSFDPGRAQRLMQHGVDMRPIVMSADLANLMKQENDFLPRFTRLGVSEDRLRELLKRHGLEDFMPTEDEFIAPQSIRGRYIAESAGTYTLSSDTPIREELIKVAKGEQSGDIFLHEGAFLGVSPEGRAVTTKTAGEKIESVVMNDDGTVKIVTRRKNVGTDIKFYGMNTKLTGGHQGFISNKKFRALVKDILREDVGIESGHVISRLARNIEGISIGAPKSSYGHAQVEMRLANILRIMETSELSKEQFEHVSRQLYALGIKASSDNLVSKYVVENSRLNTDQIAQRLNAIESSLEEYTGIKMAKLSNVLFHDIVTRGEHLVLQGAGKRATLSRQTQAVLDTLARDEELGQYYAAIKEDVASRMNLKPENLREVAKSYLAVDRIDATPVTSAYEKYKKMFGGDIDEFLDYIYDQDIDVRRENLAALGIKDEMIGLGTTLRTETGVSLSALRISTDPSGYTGMMSISSGRPFHKSLDKAGRSLLRAVLVEGVEGEMPFAVEEALTNYIDELTNVAGKNLLKSAYSGKVFGSALLKAAGYRGGRIEGFNQDYAIIVHRDIYRKMLEDMGLQRGEIARRLKQASKTGDYALLTKDPTWGRMKTPVVRVYTNKAAGLKKMSKHNVLVSERILGLIESEVPVGTHIDTDGDILNILPLKTATSRNAAKVLLGQKGQGKLFEMMDEFYKNIHVSTFDAKKSVQYFDPETGLVRKEILKGQFRKALMSKSEVGKITNKIELLRASLLNSPSVTPRQLSLLDAWSTEMIERGILAKHISPEEISKYNILNDLESAVESYRDPDQAFKHLVSATRKVYNIADMPEETIRSASVIKDAKGKLFNMAAYREQEVMLREMAKQMVAFKSSAEYRALEEVHSLAGSNFKSKQRFFERVADLSDTSSVGARARAFVGIPEEGVGAAKKVTKALEKEAGLFQGIAISTLRKYKRPIGLAVGVLAGLGMMMSKPSDLDIDTLQTEHAEPMPAKVPMGGHNLPVGQRNGYKIRIRAKGDGHDFGHLGRKAADIAGGGRVHVSVSDTRRKLYKEDLEKLIYA